MQDALRRLSFEEVASMIEPGDELVFHPDFQQLAHRLAGDRGPLLWFLGDETITARGVEIRRKRRSIGRVLAAR